MQPFKVILAEALQGETSVPVVTAHSLSFQFQNSHMPGTNAASNDLSDGNIRIGGKHTLLLQNGTLREVEMPLFEIRLKEQETLIPNLKGDEKIQAQAKFDIWNTCLTGIQSALETAMKAQYVLDNSVSEA